MTKEEIFNNYTEFIEHLATTPTNDKAALLELHNKSDKILKEMKGLNSCDASWFSERYGEWLNKEFYPKHPEKIKIKA